MRWLAVVILAAATAAAQAQTIEQRVAEVLRAMGAPPPVETVIQTGTAATTGPTVPGAAAAPAPAVQMQPAPAASQYLERLNPTLTPQQDPGVGLRGIGFVNDPRGTAIMGPPPGMSNSRAPAFMPGIVVAPANGGGAAVSGASNLTTTLRSFAAGDANP